MGNSDGNGKNKKNTVKRKSRRVKTPTILQMEAVECGAAALGIILGYFGKKVPLEELRIECGISRDGSKAGNMVKAAAKYGLRAAGYKKEPDELPEMPLPMIVHWNFNHFLVVEGFKKGHVYLNDPLGGPRCVSEEEFDQSFTGIVIAFEKDSEFVSGGEGLSIYNSLKNRLKGSENALAYSVLIGLFLVIPGLAVPVFTQVFIDEILLGNMQNWLFPLIAGLFFTGIIRILLTWLQEYYLLLLETRLTVTSSGNFFWHILRLPIDFFSQRYAGDIATRVLINDRVSTRVSRDLAASILNLIMIIFYVVLMLYYSIFLTLVGIFVAVLNVVYLRLVSRIRVDQNQLLLIQQGKLYGTSMAGIDIIETMKASGLESDYYELWSGTHAKVTNYEQKFKVSSTYLMLFPILLQGLNVAIILTVGGAAVINGHLTIGMLVAFQFLMTGFLAPVNDLVSKGGILQTLVGDLRQLEDVLKYPTDPIWHSGKDNSANKEKDWEDSEDEAKLKGELSLKDITFGYNSLAPPLIENFSLNLKPGERVALVGGSGSGKSTLAKIIAGLLQPWSGEISFDGKIREDIPRHIINNSLSTVDQEINVFDGRILDNLTLWDDTVDETEVAWAVEDACAAEIIAERKGGYDYLMEEDGRNFSGGQLQRLEIARALVNNPSILVMDEATGSLDPRTELEVSENIRRRGCTCIIIAHRLSTIRDCDEIIVLSSGKVVERGTHEDLKNNGGTYAGLIADM